MALRPEPYGHLQPQQEDETPAVRETLARSRVGTIEETQQRQAADRQRAIEAQSSFTRGFGQASTGLGTAFHGGAAMIKALAGDQEGASQSAERAQAFEDEGQLYAPEISTYKDVKDLGTAGSYAAGMLGQAVPSIATIVASYLGGKAAGGVAGGVAGGPVGAVGGAAAGAGAGGAFGLAAARGVGMKMLRKYLAKQAKKQGVPLRDFAGDAAVARQIGGQAGGRIAAVQTSIGMQQGELAAQLLDPEFDAESVFGRELSQRERAALAFAGGELGGRLEALPIMNWFTRRGLGDQVKEEINRTFTTEVGKQALQEGATEASQQLIQRSLLAVADRNREIIGEEGIEELINAGLGGAIAGGAMGGLGSLGGRQAPEQPALPPPREQPGFYLDAEGQLVPTGPGGDLVSRQQALRESLRLQEVDDVPGFSDQDIMSEIFGDTRFDEAQFRDDMNDYLGIAETQQAEPESTTLETFEVGTVPEADLDRIEGMRSGQVVPNYQFAKVIPGPQGEAIRELPFEATQRDAEGNLVKGKTIQEKIDKLNADTDDNTELYQRRSQYLFPNNEIRQREYVKRMREMDQPHRERSFAEVVGERAQVGFAGDPQAQREYVARQAQIVDESRTQPGQKMERDKDGNIIEDPAAYLAKFSVIDKPPTETGRGRGALGDVPGNLSLSGEEISKTPYGGLNIRKGEVLPPVELKKERTRRQILRTYNKNTFNQGLNEGKDIRLPNGKVLNAMSLTLAMQPKMNQLQSGQELSLPARVGQWFTEGAASLAEQGVKIDLAAIPDQTVLYESRMSRPREAGGRGITWGEAKKALETKTAEDTGRTPSVQRLDRLQRVLKGRTEPLSMAEAGQLAQQVADTIGRTVDPKRFAITEPITRDGKELSPIDQVRRVLNRIANVERRRAQPPADTDRETTRTIIKRGRPGGKVTGDRVVRTGSTKPGTPETEPQVQRPIRRYKRGEAAEVVMEEREAKLASTADITPETTITQARTGISNVNRALRLLEQAQEAEPKGRLARTKELHRALVKAGLQFEPADVFEIPATGRVPKGGASVKATVRAALQRRKEALTERGLRAKDEIDRRRGKEVKSRKRPSARELNIRQLAQDRGISVGEARLLQDRIDAEKLVWEDDGDDAKYDASGKASEEFVEQIKAIADKAGGERADLSSKERLALEKARHAQFWAKQREKADKQAQERLKREIQDQNITDAKGRKRPQPETFYENWYDGEKTAKVREKEEGLLAKIARTLKLTRPIRLATPADVKAVMDADPARAVKMLRGTVAGSHWVDPLSGYTVIFINPSVKKATQRYAVMAHEIGHAVFRDRFMAADKKTKDAIVAAYQQWRDAQVAKGDISKAEVLRSKRALPVVELTMSNEALLHQLPEKEREYVLSFEEWFADQTARYFTTAEAPRSIVAKFFRGVATYLKQVYSVMKNDGYMPDKTIRDFYGDIMAPRNDAAGQLRDAIFDAMRETGIVIQDQAVIDKIKRLARAAFQKKNRAQYSDKELATFVAKIARMVAEDGSNLNYATFRVAYNNLLNARERNQVMRAFGTKRMQNRVRRMLLNDNNLRGAEEVLRNANALVAYGYQLWKAGQLSLGPQTTSIFQRFVDRVQQILGVVSDEKRALRIFEAINSGAVLERTENGGTESFSSPAQMVNTTLQRATAGMRELGSFVSPALSIVFNTAYERMNATKNPWLRQLAEELYIPSGTQGKRQSMVEGKNLSVAKYHNRAAKILQGLDDDQKNQVVEGMASGRFSNDPEIKAVQKELKKLMREMRSYAVSRGVRIGKQEVGETGYWPWNFDTEAILANTTGFKDMLIRTMDDNFVRGTIKRVRGQKWLEIREGGEKVPVTRAMREEAAQRIMDSILLSKGYADGGSINNYEIANHTPYMASHDTRILAFIAEDSRFSTFLSKDLDKTLISYIDQTVRRAEFASRFGDEGNGNERTGAIGISEYLRRAEQAGMTKKERVMAEKYIQAMMGTLGGDINPQLRKYMNYAIVYENLRLLSMGLFSTLVDPIGILVRTGSLQDSYVALQIAVKDLATWSKRLKGKEGGKQEMRLLAETLGIIEDSIGKEALGYEYGGVYMTGMARQVNEKWFELTGISGYTRMTRVMATGAAQSFLKRHKAGLDRDSKRYLDELGVSADDVQFDRAGNLKVLSQAERETASVQELARDDRVRTAVFRFVDEAILRPDAAQRPIYASDPHFMLIFHLKGFMYSFYERIMKRAWNEAVEHKRLVPVASLGMYVPGMIAADMLRDAVKDAFGDQDDDRRDNWTIGDWTWHGMDRSGLYGPYLEQLTQSREDYTRFGKMPGISMFGPAAEHLVDFASMKGGIEAQLTRALPGQNLIRPLTESFVGNFE